MTTNNNIGSLLQFIPGFLQLMHGMNLGGQKNSVAQMANISNAMQNPNNPLYQKMYGQYRQAGQEQLGENITQMEGQNRMLSSMGRTPLFDPSRRGEMEFRAQAGMAPQIGLQAQQQTQDALARALGAYGNTMNAQNKLTALQYGPRAQTGAANQNTLGLGSLGEIFNSVPNQQPQREYGPPTIEQAYAAQQGLNAPGAQQGNSILDMLKGFM